MSENPTVCPGTAVAINKGETIDITDTTADGQDNFIGSRPNIGNCGGDDYQGKDLIYAVTALADGVLSAELDAGYDASFVRARFTCPASKDTEIACNFRYLSGKTYIEFMATANSTYYVAADSWQNREGKFQLRLSLK